MEKVVKKVNKLANCNAGKIATNLYGFKQDARDNLEGSAMIVFNRGIAYLKKYPN